MLIISRRRSQQIEIGNNVRLTILHIGSGQVRIGIEAPDDVRVLRPESRDTQPQPPSPLHKQAG